MANGPSEAGGGGLLKSMIDRGSGIAIEVALTERGGDGDRERWLPVMWVR